MKNIIVFHPSNELYGADRILVNALQSFSDEDRKTVVLVKDGPLTELLTQSVPNLKVIIQPEMPIIYRALFTPKGVLQFARNYRKFRKWLKGLHGVHEFDLAYVNTLSCSFILPMLRSLKIPSFVHVHEILEKPAIIAKVTASLASRYAGSVLCVSKAVENNLIRLNPRIGKKTVCIHNGINPIEVDRIPRLGLVQQRKMEFYVFGRIMPKKGQWYLVEALKLLSEEQKKRARFVFVGGTPPGQDHLKKELEALISESALESTITLKGFCNDISSEMSQADVCIVPSLMKDPFPTTVLEAMSARRMVIATNHGGAAEAIIDRNNGMLVPPNAPQELADAIAFAIDNPAIVEQMGTNAYETYLNKFTLEVFQKNWQQLHDPEFSQNENSASKLEVQNRRAPENTGIQVLEQNC